MRKDTSLAEIGTAGACTRAWARLFSRCISARISGVAKGSSRSKAKRRCSPGAMPQAICAASMAMVPLPQHGSCSAPPASAVPCQPGQRLLQRRVSLVLAPAALEQRFARGIHVQQRALRPQVQQQLQIGPARVDARALARLLAQLVAHRVLDAQCGEVQALQRATLRGGVDAQRVLRGDPLRPFDASGQRIQIVFVPVVGRGDLDQHTLRQPAAQVGGHQAFGIGGQRHAAAHRARRAARQQAAELVAQQRLDAGRAGQEQAPAHRLRKPCAGWPARSSRPRGTWPRCAARP
jgi:hypothetical protein